MKEGPRGHSEWTYELCSIKLQWNSDTPYLHPGVLKVLLCAWGSVCHAREVLNQPHVSDLLQQST